MNNNKFNRWAFIARHTQLDNLITFILQSEEGQTLAEQVQRDEDARDRSE